MSKEIIHYTEKALSIASLIIICQALFGAFSLSTRNNIRDRVRAKYGKLVSEVSGTSGVELEAAHLDHNKSNPNYDRAFNGLLMTIPEHYDDHVKRHSNNGLHPLDNLYALDSIWERLTTDQQDSRLPPSYYAQILLSPKHYDRWLIVHDEGGRRIKTAKSGR